MRIFVDMDGTLAKWNSVEYEQLFEQGYYRNLVPNQDILNDVNKLISEGEDVYILSCVLPESKYALEEKKVWLKQYVPQLKEEKYIFVPYGQNKADYLKEHYSPITNRDYLIDDYTKNLIEWKEYGGIGVKYLNGINHTRGTWKGLMVNEHSREDTSLSSLILSEKVRDYGVDIISRYKCSDDGDMSFECIKKNKECSLYSPYWGSTNSEIIQTLVYAIQITPGWKVDFSKFNNIVNAPFAPIGFQYYRRHYPTLSNCRDFGQLLSKLDYKTLDDMEYSLYLYENDKLPKSNIKEGDFSEISPRINILYLNWYEGAITTDDLILEVTMSDVELNQKAVAEQDEPDICND